MQQQKQSILLKCSPFPKPKTTQPLIYSLSRKRKPNFGSQRTSKSIHKATAFIISTLKILPQPLDLALEVAIGGHNNNNGGSGLFKGRSFGEWWEGGGRRRRKKKMGGFVFKVVLLFVVCCFVFVFKDVTRGDLNKFVGNVVRKSKKVVKALR